MSSSVIPGKHLKLAMLIDDPQGRRILKDQSVPGFIVTQASSTYHVGARSSLLETDRLL